MDANYRGIDNILRLSHHKILINYKDRNGDIVVENKGGHQLSQIIKFDNTKPVEQANTACLLICCTGAVTA